MDDKRAARPFGPEIEAKNKGLGRKFPKATAGFAMDKGRALHAIRQGCRHWNLRIRSLCADRIAAPTESKEIAESRLRSTISDTNTAQYMCWRAAQRLRQRPNICLACDTTSPIYAARRRKYRPLDKEFPAPK